MPFAPKQVCAGQGCGTLVASGYCVACKTVRGAERPSAHERGYGRRWQRFAKAFLQQNPLAVDVFGTHNGVIYAAQCVDHIEPHKGDMQKFWDPSNLQGLTFADHSRKTSLEDGGFGNKPK